MAKKPVTNTSAQAQAILDMWNANTTFSMGDVTKTQFQAAMTTLAAADLAVEQARTQLTALLNDRDDKQKVLQDYITRARSAARGQFGVDSTQYEQAGGTRKSERKPATRKPRAG